MGECQRLGSHFCSVYIYLLTTQRGLSPQAVYQSLLHLSWIDKFLDNIRILFVGLFSDQLKKPYTSVVECDFDVYFDQQLKELEGSVEKTPILPKQVFLEDLTPPSSSDNGNDDLRPPIPGLLQREHVNLVRHSESSQANIIILT